MPLIAHIVNFTQYSFQLKKKDKLYYLFSSLLNSISIGYWADVCILVLLAAVTYAVRPVLYNKHQMSSLS